MMDQDITRVEPDSAPRGVIFQDRLSHWDAYEGYYDSFDAIPTDDAGIAMSPITVPGE